MKSQHVQLLYGNGEAIRPIKGTYPHIASTPREVGVSHDHEFRSFVRLLCLTREQPATFDDLAPKLDHIKTITAVHGLDVGCVCQCSGLKPRPSRRRELLRLVWSILRRMLGGLP